MFDDVVNLFKGFFVHVKYLAEANCPVKGTCDQVAKNSLFLDSALGMRQFKLAQYGHQTVDTQIDIHEIRFGVILEISEVERAGQCGKEQVAIDIVLMDEELLGKTSQEVFGMLKAF